MALLRFALLTGCKPKPAPATALTNPDGTTTPADARKGFGKWRGHHLSARPSTGRFRRR